MGKIRYENLLTSALNVDDNVVHYIPGPLVTDAGVLAEVTKGGGQAPDSIVIAAVFAAETGAPTSMSVWLEFRVDDDDNWTQCLQRFTGVLTAAFPIVPADCPGTFTLFHVKPEGHQMRVAYQGTGCTGAAYFTFTQVTARYIPRGEA